MADPLYCPVCHTPLDPAEAEGLCIACLLGAGAGDTMPSAGPEQNPAPVQMGNYELLGVLARGGQGVVYRARDMRTGRVVALKTLPQTLLPGEAAGIRFREEALRAARLEHPNIVRVYEVGEENGQWFFTMELAEGGSLASPASALSREPRPVAGMMAKIARAVAHAHSSLVLHRDLKPANILLDVHGEPRVADFGLARDLDGDTGITRSGAVLGTPVYMAPEQAAGKKDLTTAADVYGLGAVLYEMLTGRPPFRAETWQEVLRRVMETEPDRPRSVNRDVDSDLEIIVLKCLEKDPRRRYRDAASLAEDLERWLRDEPITAHAPGRAYRLLKWVKRHPALAAFYVLSGISVAVGAAVWQQQKEKRLIAGHLYAADIAGALRLADTGQMKPALALLDRARAGAGEHSPWEWRWLHDLATKGDPAAAAVDLPGPVRALAFAPDGRLFAGGDGFLLTADPGGWKFNPFPGPQHVPGAAPVPMQRLPSVPWALPDTPAERGSGNICSLAVSRDGRFLAVGATDRRLRILDATSGDTLTTMDSLRTMVTFAGGLLVAGHDFDPLTGGSSGFSLCDHGLRQEVFRERNAGAVLSAGEDGAWLLGGGGGDSLAAWAVLPDVTGWRGFPKVVRVSGVAFANVPAPSFVAMDPAGRWFFSCHRDGAIRYFGEWQAMRNGDPPVLENTPEFSGKPACGAFSGDGAVFAWANDGVLRSYGTATSDPDQLDLRDQRRLRGHRGWITCMTWNAAGSLLASGDDIGHVRIWTRASLEAPRRLRFPEGVVPVLSASAETAAWHREGALLTSPAADSGRAVKFAQPWHPVHAVSGQEVLAVGQGEGQAVILARVNPAAETVPPGVTLEGAAWPFTGASASPGGRFLCGSLPDGTAGIWESRSGTLTCRTMTAVTHAAFSVVDGTHWLTAAEPGGLVRTWRCGDGALQGSFDSGLASVASLTVSQQGALAALASDDSPEVRLFRLPDGEEAGRLQASSRAVMHLALSTDGRTLAIAAREGPLHLMDTRTLRYLGAPPDAVQGPWRMLRFSEDGNVLAALARQLHLWHAPP